MSGDGFRDPGLIFPAAPGDGSTVAHGDGTWQVLPTPLSPAYAIPADSGSAVQGVQPTAGDVAAGNVHITGGHAVQTADGAAYVKVLLPTNSRALLAAVAVNGDSTLDRKLDLDVAQSSPGAAWFRIKDNNNGYLVGAAVRFSWMALYLV